MTDTEARALGARWTAALADHDRGPWRAGMRVLPVPDSDPEERDLESGITTEPGDIATVVSTRDRCVTVAWETDAGSAEGGTLLSDDVPDLRDAATRGACLDVVREVWGFPQCIIVPLDRGRWAWKAPDVLRRPVTIRGDTEAEAIIAAAEAAKERA